MTHSKRCDLAVSSARVVSAVGSVAFSVAPMRKGFLLREHKYAYIQYGEDAAGGIEQREQGLAHLLAVADEILRFINDYVFQLTKCICNEWVVRSQQSCRSQNAGIMAA